MVINVWGKVGLRSGVLPHADPTSETMWVPSSIRKGLSRSQKLLNDLNSKGGHQQEFYCTIHAVWAGTIKYLFSLEVGEATQNQLIKLISQY